MSEKYEAYLADHISNVNRAFEWMLVNMPELFNSYDAEVLGEQISNHDASKFTDEEYDAYDDYFNSERTQEVKDAFDYAWLHHQRNNPHHWQHWLLREDDGDMKALEMPEQYVYEMIADWWAFSWAKDNLYEIFKWYFDNKKKMLLHKNTQKLVEDILDKMKLLLDSKM